MHAALQICRREKACDMPTRWDCAREPVDPCSWTRAQWINDSHPGRIQSGEGRIEASAPRAKLRCCERRLTAALERRIQQRYAITLPLTLLDDRRLDLIDGIQREN